MALLDLQGMQQRPSTSTKGGSRGSKGCTVNNGGGGASRLSLALC